MSREVQKRWGSKADRETMARRTLANAVAPAAGLVALLLAIFRRFMPFPLQPTKSIAEFTRRRIDDTNVAY